MYPVPYGNVVKYICNDKLCLGATLLSCIINLMDEKGGDMVLFSYYFLPQEL